MKNVDFLLSSFKSSSKSKYFNKCDLISKYNVTNVLELPKVNSVSITCDNSYLDNSYLDDDVIKFQQVLLYYFLILILPSIYSKNGLLFKIKVADNLKIDFLLNYFFLESNILIKKKIKNKKILIIKDRTKYIAKLELEFLTKNLILNKELYLFFDDISVSSIDKLLLSINVYLKQSFVKKLDGISSDKFFQNIQYLWAF